MDNLMPVIIVQAVSVIATLAGIAAVSRGHEKRIDNIEKIIVSMVGHELRIEKLEKAMEELPSKYVPRNELQLMLSAIGKITEDTKALLQALVYGGGDREVAKQALDRSKKC